MFQIAEKILSYMTFEELIEKRTVCTMFNDSIVKILRRRETMEPLWTYELLQFMGPENEPSTEAACQLFFERILVSPHNLLNDGNTTSATLKMIELYGEYIVHLVVGNAHGRARAVLDSPILKDIVKDLCSKCTNVTILEYCEADPGERVRIVKMIGPN